VTVWGHDNIPFNCFYMSKNTFFQNCQGKLCDPESEGSVKN
jgi:hypothetical protein